MSQLLLSIFGAVSDAKHCKVLLSDMMIFYSEHIISQCFVFVKGFWNFFRIILIIIRKQKWYWIPSISTYFLLYMKFILQFQMVFLIDRLSKLGAARSCSWRRCCSRHHCRRSSRTRGKKGRRWQNEAIDILIFESFCSKTSSKYYNSEACHQ